MTVMLKKLLSFSLCLLFAAALFAEPGSVHIIIKTTPDEADVFLDNEKIGQTPLELNTIRAGHYLFRIEKDGYCDYDFTADFSAGMYKEYAIQLERITGTLKIETNISGTQLYINGERIYGSAAVLPEGMYTVEAVKFGYSSFSKTVQVVKNIETEVTAVLEKADFAVSGFSVGKTPFNPANPDSFGRLRISFTVSASGSGKILIKDESGAVCDVIGPDSFTEWDQLYYWDGKNCADGTYTVTLEAQGADSSQDTIIKTLTAAIDSSLFYPFTIVSSSAAGTGQSPSARLYPSGTWYFSSSAAVQMSDIAGVSPLDKNIPSTSAAVLHTPLPFLEAAVHASMMMSSDSSASPFAAGASVKIGTVQKKNQRVSPLAAAVSLYYDNNSEVTAYIQKDTGAGADICASFTAGYVTAGISTGVRAGNEIGLFNASDTRPSFSQDIPFPLYWKNTASLRLRYKNFTAGLAAGLVTSPETNALSFSAEAAFIIPQTRLMIFLQSAFYLQNISLEGIECGGGFAVII